MYASPTLRIRHGVVRSHSLKVYLELRFLTHDKVSQSKIEITAGIRSTVN